MTTIPTTMHPDQLLELAAAAIDAVGHAVVAGDQDTALTKLGDASDAVAFLRSWDLPPRPGQWTIWQRKIVTTLLRSLAACTDTEIVQQVREGAPSDRPTHRS